MIDKSPVKVPETEAAGRQAVPKTKQGARDRNGRQTGSETGQGARA
ncbi:MAG: hypothetical protein LBC46_04050 [Treponema sp.]|nr:hypothetical protein [Treponema sp.]